MKASTSAMATKQPVLIATNVASTVLEKSASSGVTTGAAMRTVPIMPV